MANQKEHLEQKALIQWFRLQYPRYSKCLWAIPNGGARHIKTAVALKNEGVLSGVSDLFLMKPMGLKSGLFIEMKAVKGRVSENQREFIDLATMMGYQAEVCYGFEAAKKIITNYLHQ